jgi:superfamily I DNA and/or RNA helicase
MTNSKIATQSTQALNVTLLKAKDKKSRGDIRRELRKLAKEERQRQQQAVSDVIKDADVILSTLTGSLSHQLKDVSFDIVIIDEAAQALEVACWMAILKVL